VKIIFLGTGPSLGVPVPTCHCETCSSKDSRDKRLRSSLYVDSGDVQFVIDCGPDFRQQVLRYNIENIDFILLTHKHNDHIGGIDDIRPFNYHQKENIKIFGSEETLKDVRTRFYYSFEERPYPGTPKIDLIEVEKGIPFEIKDIKIQPIEVFHGSMSVFGFRISKFTYITDAKYISEDQINLVKGTEYLVINALHPTYKHKMHFDLEDALEFIDKIKPKQAFITHMSHKFPPYEQTAKILPENVVLAYDGLTLEF